MSKYDRAVKDYVLDSVNILDVVGSKLELKGAGDSKKGLCPFHSEKTPSFVVSASRKTYHCFGCGAHGNAIDFLMQTENLDFLEALETLADRYALDLSTYLETKDVSSDYGFESKIYSMNLEAAKYYRDRLMEFPVGLEYFKDRGLSMDTIKVFGLGYSPDCWDSLIVHLKKLSYSEDDLLKSGLASKTKKGTLIDRFRNRLMFPILDYRNKVLGFGARAMGSDMPKYLNSSENSVFIKSKILYGDRISRKAKSGDSVILVEGYMDLIQLYQNNFYNVLASMGTALTERQAARIAQRYKKVFFAYDMDEAGRNAIDRSIPVLEAAGLDLRIMELSGAKDPDEYLKRFGASAFKDRMDKALNIIRYRLKSLKNDFDLSDSKERLDFISSALALIGGLKGDVEKEVYLRELEDISGISYSVLSAEYVRKKNNKDALEAGTQKNDGLEIASETQNIDNAGMDHGEVESKTEVLKSLELELLKMALQSRNMAGKIFTELGTLLSQDNAALFSALMIYFVQEETFDPVLAADIIGYDFAIKLEGLSKKTDSLYDDEDLNKLIPRWEYAMVKEELRKVDERLSEIKGFDGSQFEVEERALRTKRNKLSKSLYKKRIGKDK